MTVLSSACATSAGSSVATREQVPQAPAEHARPQSDVWFKGSIAASFEQAKKENKPIFLYWGAVWCPPCNELKSNIFSKPRFAERMQAFVPVYLDGDSEEAQVWGEKLQISGYPTVLVLDSERTELFRLNSSINLEEFEQAMEPLLTSSQNFGSALERLKGDKSEAADWRILAFADWEQIPSTTLAPREKTLLLQEAVRRIPASLEKERSMLAAQLLRAVAKDEKSPLSAGELAAIKKAAPRYLEAIFHDAASIQASRLYINNEAGALAAWLYPDAGSAAYKKTRDAWLAAAMAIAADEGASIDTRLWSVNPQLDFFRHEHREGRVPDALRSEVQAAVAIADQRAKDPYNRHAVISGAAYLLRAAGDLDGARALLAREAAATDTPWYYYSSLAGLEQEAGQKDEARKWAAKARESVQGRASKIQWITSDIVLNAKLPGDAQKAYLLAVTKEFYELATELSDGFAGRNRKRAETVKDSLKAFRKDQDFLRLAAQYQKRCDTLKGENQSSCEAYFKDLLQQI